MAKIFMVAVSLLLLFSCSKPDAALEPAPIPPAIQAMMTDNNNCTCEPVIDEYRFGLTTVYHLYVTGPACNSVSIFYGSDGVALAYSFDQLYIRMIDESKFVRNVWRCKG